MTVNTEAHVTLLQESLLSLLLSSGASNAKLRKHLKGSIKAKRRERNPHRLSTFQPQLSDGTSLISGMIRGEVGKFTYEKALSRQACACLAEISFLWQKDL